MGDKPPVAITDSVKKEDWNNFVYKNEYANIFQTLDMAEVYNKSKGNKALTLAAINEDTNEILATMVARKRMEKTGLLSSFSVHSTIRGGPIFVNDDVGISSVSRLLQYHDHIMKKEAIYSRIYPVYNVPQIVPCFMENDYEFEGWNNFLIDLNKPIDEIWKNLEKSRRYGVNKAKKRGVEIGEIEEKTLIPFFYDLLLETHISRKSESHSTLEDLNYFKMLFQGKMKLVMNQISLIKLFLLTMKNL